MTVSVGGINVGIGIDYSKAMNGAEGLKKELLVLSNSFKNIRLDAAISGKSSSAIKGYYKTINEQLGKVRSTWAENIGYVEESFDKFAIKARMDMVSVIEQFDKLSASFNTIKLSGGAEEIISTLERIRNLSLETTKALSKGGATRKSLVSYAYEGKVGLSGIESKQTMNPQLPNNLQSYLNGLKGISEQTDKYLNQFNKAIENVSLKSNKEVKLWLDKIIASLEMRMPKIKEEMEGFGNVLNRKVQLQERYDISSRLKNATSEVAIFQKLKEKIVSARIAEAGYRKEISMGINANANKVALLKSLESRIEMGRKLTPKLTAEMERLRKETEKPSRDTGFLSKEWFKNRMGWFLELRLAWGAYRGIGNLVNSVVDYQNQVARAFRVAESQIMSSTEILNSYSTAMKEAIGIHGGEWEDLGNVLYQLGSAGLWAEEAIAALNSTMSLLVATEGDSNEVTKLVAGIYNNFGDTITHVTTLEDKFLYINDVLAKVWKEHQIEISELVTGYSYLASTGKLTNLTFEQMGNILGLLNDNLIKGSKAGTEMRTVLLKIAQNASKFEENFGISIDPTKSLDILDIFDQLATKLGKGDISVSKLALVFEDMGARSINSLLAIIRNWDEWEDKIKQTGESTGEAAEIEKRALDTMSKSWSKLWGSIKAYASEASILLEDVQYWIDKMNKALQMGRNVQDIQTIADIFSKLDKTSTKAKFIQDLSKEDIALIKEYIKTQKGVTALSAAKNVIGVGSLSKDIKTGSNLKILKELLGLYDEMDKIGITSRETLKVDTKQEVLDAKTLLDISNLTIESNEENLSITEKDIKAKEEAYEKAKKVREELEKAIIAGSKNPEIAQNLRTVYGTSEETTEGADVSVTFDQAAAELNLRSEYVKRTQEELKAEKSLYTAKKKYNDDNISSAELDLQLSKKKLEILEEEASKAIKNSDIESQIIQINDDIINKTEKLNKLKELGDKWDGRTNSQIAKSTKLRELEVKELIKVNDQKAKSRFIDSLETQIKINEEKKKGIDNSIEELKVGKEDTDQINKIYELQQQKNDLSQDNIDIQRNINQLNNENVDLIQLQYDVSKKTVDNQRSANKAQRDSDNENLRIKKEEEQLEVRLLELALAQKEAELVGDNEEILRIKREILNVENESYSKMKELTSDQTKIKNYEDKIKDNKTESLDLIEEELKYSNSLLYVYKQLVKEAQSFQEAKVSWISKAYTEGASGLATVLQNSTGGFQEQRQEAAELKVELKELKEEYDEAISEGNAERVVEITDEMKNLRTQIDELEDPIENLKDAFKSFFKDLVDSIRQAINEWIAMQVVMGIASALTTTTSSTGGQIGGAISSNINVGASAGYATGGVLPKITAFRKFSSGGMTNAPSLAVLGDNASGKEIVIPEENIKSNSVSGYVRNQGSTPIYIANVIRETDAPRLLSGPSGKNTIVNYVIDDIHSKGPIYRKLKTG